MENTGTSFTALPERFEYGLPVFVAGGHAQRSLRRTATHLTIQRSRCDNSPVGVGSHTDPVGWGVRTPRPASEQLDCRRSVELLRQPGAVAPPMATLCNSAIEMQMCRLFVRGDWLNDEWSLLRHERCQLLQDLADGLLRKGAQQFRVSGTPVETFHLV